MIDCHCHIHKEYNCIFNLPETIDITEIKERNTNINTNQTEKEYYSYGIHPWNVTNEIECEKYLLTLQTLLKEKRIIAIGECGLDTKLTQNDILIQKKWFIKQIELAQEYQVPVYIHTVNTINDIISLKKKWKDQIWIIHGFTSALQQAKQLIDLNCYISIGRSVLNKNNVKINQILKLAFERRRLLIETDNDDSHVVDLKDIYVSIAERLEIDVEMLKEYIHDVVGNLFHV